LIFDRDISFLQLIGTSIFGRIFAYLKDNLFQVSCDLEKLSFLEIGFILGFSLGSLFEKMAFASPNLIPRLTLNLRE